MLSTALKASSCPTAPPLTPVGRLSAAEQRLEAMIRAVQIVRSPLGRLYDSLSDEQRRQFNAIGNFGKGGREPGSAPSGGDLATLCDQQAGGGFANLPVQRIAQVVRPNTQQQNALADLKKASEDAASDLQASCPTQMPQTPVARLDAVATRLKVMADAMKSVRPKLENFYASLSDEQKANFNTMGSPQPAIRAVAGRLFSLSHRWLARHLPLGVLTSRECATLLTPPCALEATPLPANGAGGHRRTTKQARAPPNPRRRPNAPWAWRASGRAASRID
jgi:hypothetical protein